MSIQITSQCPGRLPLATPDQGCEDRAARCQKKNRPAKATGDNAGGSDGPPWPCDIEIELPPVEE